MANRAEWRLKVCLKYGVHAGGYNSVAFGIDRAALRVLHEEVWPETASSSRSEQEGKQLHILRRPSEQTPTSI